MECKFCSNNNNHKSMFLSYGFIHLCYFLLKYNVTTKIVLIRLCGLKHILPGIYML